MQRKIISFFYLAFGASYAYSQKVDTIKKADATHDSTRVFTLGEITVFGSHNENTINSSKISSAQMQEYTKYTVSSAINMLPGTTLTSVGPRNESTVYIRGFDLHQVPLLIDGIPVYVPYNGYVDMARFTTFDVSEIQVYKNYTPVTYGPNSMGGAINLISRRPVKKFELIGASGWQTGGYRTNINVGSRWEKFYVQAGYSKFERDYFPLSHDFVPTKHQSSGNRGNSYNDDQKFNAKIAFTPNGRSEYTISYINQNGTKGTPVYAGSDIQNSLYSKPRYWKWPKWNKQSLYFLSNTAIGIDQYVKTRLYYDQFVNTLNSYDDSTYTKISKPYAFISYYNDYTLGGIAEYGKNFSQRDNLVINAQYKYDVHREHNQGQPQRTMSDETYTIAAENQLTVIQQLLLSTGASFNNRTSVKAQDYNSSTGEITNFTPNSNNAVNAQAGLQYNVDTNNILNLSVARKTRFATTQDRYSYSLGTALPNPDLKAEYTINYNLSYKGSLFENKLNLNAAVFYSQINNTILSVNNVAVDPNTGIKLSQLQNVGQSEYKGAEIGVQYHPITSLIIGGNYTYIDRKNITNPNIYLTDVPKNKVFGFVQYALNNIFSIQVNTEYDSKRYSTSYGTVSKAFTLFNTKVDVHVYKWFSLEAGVNNIFDRNYTLVEGYPEAGRNYLVNLVYKY